MSTKAFFAVALLVAFATWGCNGGSQKTNGTDSASTRVDSNLKAIGGPPYLVKVEEYVNPALPGLHSYAHAVYQDKMVMIGGRINGMHNDYNFDLTFANQKIYVVDTKNWSDPTGWTVSSMPFTNIKGVNNKQFRSNNAQFYTQNDVLYIVGGMEYANVPTMAADSTGPVLLKLLKLPKGGTEDKEAAHGPYSLPYITAVDLGTLVDAVMNNKTVSPPSVRQAKDSLLAITGGELTTMGDSVYLVFGWDFNSNTSVYSHQVRSFKVTDDGKTLSMSKVVVCPTCWDGVSDPNSTSGAFRRRDGGLSSFVDPKDGTEGAMFYAGVFKDGTTNFTDPVFVHPGRTEELTSATLYSNVYTCQIVPVYSPSRKSTYATLLGGMSYTKYTGGAITGPTLLSGSNTKVLTGGFNGIPLSNQFTTVMMTEDGTVSQYLLPDSFPVTAAVTEVPTAIPPSSWPIGTTTWNGSESEIFWTLSDELMPKDVVDYDQFIAKNPEGGVVAYLHGGIEGKQPNVFGAANRPLFNSVASKRLFAVRIVPVK